MSELQRSITGTIVLYGNRAMAEIIDILQERDFSDWLCRVTFQCSAEIFRQGKTITAALIDDHLSKIEQYTGISSLADMTEHAHPPGILRQMGEELAESALKERLAFGLTELGSRVTGMKLDEVYAEVQEVVTEDERSSGLVTAQTVINGLLSQKPEESLIGVPTGLQTVDSLLTFNGVPRGQVTTVGGDSGHGKSAFVAAIEFNAAKSGLRVLDATLEDDPAARMKRFISGACQIDNGDVQRWDIPPHRRSDVQYQLNNWNEFDIVYMEDYPRNVFHLLSQIQRAHFKKPLDLVIIDYLQLIPAHAGKSQQERTDAVFSEIVQLARRKEFQRTAFVVACQLRKRHDEQRRPTLDDLYHSNAIRQWSHTILFTWWPMRHWNMMKILVDKQKHGRSFIEGAIGWKPEFVQFYDEVPPIQTSFTMAVQDMLKTKERTCRN